MRLNRFLASGTDLSRRKADDAIAAGRVTVNGDPAALGTDISPTDIVALDGQPVRTVVSHTTVMLNKPVGLVVSRQGQGSRTIYDILPPEYQHLNPVGRLDKDSSGLLLLTDDGALAHELTHPSSHKTKEYQITLDKPLQPDHRRQLIEHGVTLDDGLSRFDELQPLTPDDHQQWLVSMHEGRNRQIRRTFGALGYTVQRLHRSRFGDYHLADIPSGSWRATTFKR